MTKSLRGLFLVFSMLMGSWAVAAETSSILIQGHVKIADEELVFRFTCVEHARCRIAMGDFEGNLTAAKNIIVFQIVSGADSFAFIDENRITTLSYGNNVKTFSLFDLADENYVRNGMNEVAGFIKLSVTRVD